MAPFAPTPPPRNPLGTGAPRAAIGSRKVGTLPKHAATNPSFGHPSAAPVGGAPPPGATPQRVLREALNLAPTAWRIGSNTGGSDREQQSRTRFNPSLLWEVISGVIVRGVHVNVPEGWVPLRTSDVAAPPTPPTHIYVSETRLVVTGALFLTASAVPRAERDTSDTPFFFPDPPWTLSATGTRAQAVPTRASYPSQPDYSERNDMILAKIKPTQALFSPRRDD